MKLTFSAQLMNVTSKVDRTLKLVLNTQEMGKDAGELTILTGQQLNVLFVSPDEIISEQDVPDAPAGEEYGIKTPAQRQRGILYRIWEARNKPNGDFESYYRVRMSKNEEALKTELDSLTT